MIVIGLTGGMGMGKSFAARLFRLAGVRVFDADAAVHALQAQGGGAVGPIGVAFPGTIVEGAVERGRLRAAVLGDRAALTRLEGIVHPMVREAERRFLARARRDRRRVVALDVPLLLETGDPGRVDLILVVSAPRAVQVARVRRRRRMSETEIAGVLARQMPDAEKRRRADVVIRTGLSKRHAQVQVRRLLARLGMGR